MTSKHGVRLWVRVLCKLLGGHTYVTGYWPCGWKCAQCGYEVRR